MDKTVTLIQTEQPEMLYGVSGDSSDRTLPRDIPALSKRYREISQTGEKDVPFFVLSEGYDPQAGDMRLFIGGNVPAGGLEEKALPAGLDAQMTVKPKLGFLWGPAIGEAKRWFYTTWLQEAECVALNMEYERHDSESLGRNARIRLLFAIAPR